MSFPKALDPFRSIPAVARAAKASPGPLLAWWFGGLAAFVLLYVAVYIPAFLILAGSSAANDGEPPLWAIGIFGFLLLFLLVALIVGQCWWRIGLLNLLADVLRTGGCALEGSMRTRGRLGAIVGANLLLVVIVLATYAPFALGFAVVAVTAEGGEPSGPILAAAVVLGFAWFAGLLYVFLGLVFVNAAAALDDVGAVEAVRRSWRAASGHRLALVWLLFVTALAVMAGVLLLCVGYFFTAALGELVPAEAYLALTRGEDRTRWWSATGVPGEPPARGAPPTQPDAF